MLRKYRNTSISVSVLSRTDKQQIGSFVVKPRDIGRQTYVLGPDHPVSPAVGQNQEAQKLNAYLIFIMLLENIDQHFKRLRTISKLDSCFYRSA